MITVGTGSDSWSSANQAPFHSHLLEGSIAIITGGGTGLGRAIARELGRAGATLVLAGRRPLPLEASVDEFHTLGITAVAEPTDIRQPDQVEALVAHAVDRFGQVNILVNNAGGQFPARAEDITDRGWRAVIETNLHGTFLMTQAVGRQLIRQGHGGVVTNIVVPSLSRGIPGIAHSVAARAGVCGLTKTLAREWAPHQIRINAVGPGLFLTEGLREEMLHHAGPDFVERTSLCVPLGRTGRPEELGWLVTFLSSPLSRFVTGEYVTIDGGQSLAAGISLLPGV